MKSNVLITSVEWFANLIVYAIIARFIFGWIGLADRNNAIYNILCEFTDPILTPFRKMAQDSPFSKTMFIMDFSPMLAFFFIGLVANLIISIIIMF